MNRMQVGILIVGALYITALVFIFGAMERRIVTAERAVVERCK